MEKFLKENYNKATVVGVHFTSSWFYHLILQGPTTFERIQYEIDACWNGNRYYPVAGDIVTFKGGKLVSYNGQSLEAKP